jgi:hypothetical protein
MIIILGKRVVGKQEAHQDEEPDQVPKKSFECFGRGNDEFSPGVFLAFTGF